MFSHDKHQVAEDIRHLLDEYDRVIPTLLEIPSRDKSFDVSKDFIIARINRMLAVNQ